MSGLEIAGVVVGALPVLVTGAKAVKLSMTIWNVKTRYSDIVGTIDDQMIVYEQNLRWLLRLLEQRCRLKYLEQDVTAVLWGSQELQEDLEDRIGHRSFTWIRKEFEIQSKIVQKLQGLLDKAPAQASFVEQLKIALGFINHQESVDALKKSNDRITGFLRREHEMARFSTSESFKQPSTYDAKTCRALSNLQGQARSLRQLFHPQSWGCQCPLVSHPCCVTVLAEDGFRQRGGFLELLLGPVDSKKRVRVVIRQSEIVNPNEEADQDHEAPSRVIHQAMMESVRFVVSRLWTSKKNIPTPVPSRSKPESISCTLFSTPEIAIPAAFRLNEENSALMELNPPDQSNSPARVTTLEGFYKSVGRLNRRLQLGIKLAYCILGLGTTAWFPRGWDDTDIFVYDNVTAVPFYHHHCVREALKRRVDARTHAEMAIFSLGIILLQLIFQQRLNEQPFWRDFFVNGKENDRTLERAALQWQEAVEEDHGEEIASVIYRCLAIKFSVNADLNSRDFIQEVLATVVRPLENYARCLDWRSTGKAPERIH